MRHQRFVLYMILTMALSMGLTGCGVKPKNLEPPSGAEGTAFPATYPDTATDPVP